ncbi:MAG: hypothetical protein ACK56F_17825 [bacterium]
MIDRSNREDFICGFSGCRCEDIAKQLVKAVTSGKLKVAFGGGIEKFREGTTHCDEMAL